jgi:ATP-dependent RNA helicase RhlE
VADDERPYLKAIERATKVKPEIVPLPENFLEAVRNLPKPAAPRKGPSQSPAQQAKRAEGQRRYQDGQKAQRGAPDKAHRGEGDGAKKPFRRRRGGGGSVGAHKGAVQRTGAPR